MIYSDWCISPNELDSIHVQITLPDNNICSTNFALWDTILDVKYYILYVLQPKIKNIQQIQCVMHYSNQEYEVDDYTALKQIWDKCSINIYVNIEHYKDIKKISHISDGTVQDNMIHPEYGNVLDTNATVPWPAIGYKNKKTGKIYKNTTVQTVFETTDFDSQFNENRKSLKIQTTQTQDATTGVCVEIGTQSETINILQSLNTIKEIIPHEYITHHKSKMIINNINKYACIIQKSMRMWMSRIKFERMLKYYYFLKQVTNNKEQSLKNIIYTEQQRTIINLQYPTKSKDFEALYSSIHDYYTKIKSDVKNNTFKAVKNENKSYLKEELKCLKEINKQRNQEREIQNEKKIFKQLNDISKPITMTRTNGETIFIETPETSQAQQFLELYIALKNNNVSKNERIKLLIKLQEILEEFKEVDLTKPIINLITRELTLLNVVQLNDSQLKLLRKRIEIVFQWILKQPEINPAITKTLKSVSIFKCYNCRKLKPLNKFVVKLDLTKKTKCTDCRHLQRITTKQINLIPYENMLKNIKITEAKLFSKSIFTCLSTEDIYYLVTIIWKRKSAISESNDIIQLRLVRWHNNLTWSPLNTILLTIKEAYDHSKIHNIKKVYPLNFISKIHFNHMLAKKYFKGLTENLIECN